MSSKPAGMSLTDERLDTILAVQIAVARLGEKPFRFWWNSDIADVDGGADLLQRMVGAEGRFLGHELDFGE